MTETLELVAQGLLEAPDEGQGAGVRVAGGHESVGDERTGGGLEIVELAGGVELDGDAG